MEIIVLFFSLVYIILMSIDINENNRRNDDRPSEKKSDQSDKIKHS